MKKETILFFLPIVIFVFNSCGMHDSYYSKVKKNKNEFYEIIGYIEKNGNLSKMDSVILSDKNVLSLERTCVYKRSSKDSIISLFMEKYDLDRICYERKKDKFYDSVIIFHKDYNPIIGASKTIDYDFGKSPLRDRINSGVKKEGDYSLKIIDDFLIYSVTNTPAFGE